MRKYIITLMLVIMGLIVMNQFCWAYEPKPTDWSAVSVKKTPPNTYYLDPCPINITAVITDYWWGLTISNTADSSVVIRVLDKNNVLCTSININLGGSSMNSFINAPGGCQLNGKAILSVNGIDRDTCAIIMAPKTPSLTQWGVISLVALILISGIYLLVRRRKLITA